MKWVKRILISVAILVLVGVGSFALYGIAYAGGETAGYENGHSVGHEAGYSLGQQEGYVSGKQEGYVSGKKDGYDEGYVSGEQEGYVSGKAEGYANGHKEGYDEGLEAGLGHGYTLKDPTYAEVVTFLRQDKTDKNEYNSDTYDCTYFTRDVSDNAEQQGLRSAVVLIDLRGGAHAIIAFNTIDRGLVYFEPQFDLRVKVTVGKSYSQMNGYQ
ncbi:hypothetical protein ACFLSK_03825, partial [Chloroflexota bacterium]